MRTTCQISIRHGTFRPSDVNADLRVRNTWVTSVDVTMKTRARKAVLLHLVGGLERQIQEGWIEAYFFRRGKHLVNEHSTRMEQTQTSCINSES